MTTTVAGSNSTTTVDRVTEILRGAIQVLDRDGWCQGQGQDDAGRRCLVNALFHSTDQGFGGVVVEDLDVDVWDDLEPYLRAQDAIAREAGITADLLPEWNDDPGRTVEQVKAVLTAAADRWTS